MKVHLCRLSTSTLVDAVGVDRAADRLGRSVRSVRHWRCRDDGDPVVRHALACVLCDWLDARHGVTGLHPDVADLPDCVLVAILGGTEAAARCTGYSVDHVRHSIGDGRATAPMRRRLVEAVTEAVDT